MIYIIFIKFDAVIPLQSYAPRVKYVKKSVLGLKNMKFLLSPSLSFSSSFAFKIIENDTCLLKYCTTSIYV